MSRHHAQARCGTRDVFVVAGYDRPRHEVFRQGLTAHDGDPGAEEEVVYASVREPWLDCPSWRPSPVNSLDSASSFRTAC